MDIKTQIGKGKRVKLTLQQATKAQGAQKYSYTLSLTPVLDWGAENLAPQRHSVPGPTSL